MDDWLTYFESKMALEPLAVREAISDALSWLNQHAPQTLGDKPLSDKALARVAGGLYRHAATQDELMAFQQVLSLLWERQVERNPSLHQPEVWRPLPPQRPTVTQQQLPMGMVEWLVSHLLKPSAGQGDSSDDKAEAGRWLLLVAWESGTDSLAMLKAIAKAPLSSWVSVQSPALLTLYLPETTSRVWLGAVGSALMSYLRAKPVWKAVQRRPEKCIAAWLEQMKSVGGSPWRQEALSGICISQVVRDINLLSRSIGLRGMWQHYTALADPVMIRAFSGQCSPVLAGRAHSQSVEALPECDRRSAFHKEASLHRQFCACLREYQRINPKDTRTRRSYKQTLAALQALTSQRLSRASVLALRWLTALFAFGSAWKEKLAPSTLLTYHSSLTTFIKFAWPDDAVFELPAEDFQVVCQQGLVQFEQADAQYTVLRFLQFCQRYPEMPTFELEELSILSSRGMVRANYLAPAHFDDICRRFSQGKGSFEQQIVLFMQLCYYAALREDEALSLRCQDICFDTGMIYITADKRRKSLHAVRKIPMALLPPFVITALGRQCSAQSHQRSAEDDRLFDHWHYPSLEAQFINFAREALDDATLVTHSLRHSGANNWVVMMSMLAFDYQPDEREKPFFLRHCLFESEQLQSINTMLESMGYPVSLYFPVLEWVSERVGHAGPATTFTVYLHLLDWLCLALTAEPIVLLKRDVRRWLSPSNYSFELQKQIFIPQPPIPLTESGKPYRFLNDTHIHPSESAHSAGVIVPEALQRVAIKRLKGVQRFAVKVLPKKVPCTEITITFSQFVAAVRHASLGGADAHLPEGVKVWLSHYKGTFPRLALSARQQPAWLRLCQCLESGWSSRTLLMINSIQHLRKAVLNGEAVTTIRQMNRVLRGYRVLGLQHLTIAVHAYNSGQTNTALWQRVIERHDCQVDWKPSEYKRISAALKPYHLGWPLWHELGAILDLVVAYDDYCQSITRKVMAKGRGDTSVLTGEA